MPISIKFPFKETTEGGVFYTNATTLEAIQTNMIALLTMKKRNRVMRNNLYSPLWDYMFEQWDDISEERLKGDLIEKIGEFIAEVEVIEILFTFLGDDNLLEVKIVYKINDLGGLVDDVSVVIPIMSQPGGTSSGAPGDEHTSF